MFLLRHDEMGSADTDIAEVMPITEPSAADWDFSSFVDSARIIVPDVASRQAERVAHHGDASQVGAPRQGRAG
jgi:hypothetical protein